MTSYDIARRNSSRTDKPFNPDQQQRIDFARQATIDAFGWRFAKTLDQADFRDRLPSPEARLAE